MPEKDYFKIDGSILFQLGESLISNPIQALIELVKNSYDADATFAKITINTKPDNADCPGQTCLIVEDNGVGMDRDAISNGWLRISTDVKRNLKSRGVLTERGRTPLGDKGLGRLGTQRLGECLTVSTRRKGSPSEWLVSISWNQFRDVPDLSAVGIEIKEIPPQRDHGTKVLITGLRDVDEWTKDALHELETSLSRLISPFKEIRDFTVVVTVDGTRLNIADISDQIRDLAQYRYELVFDGTVLRVVGRAKMDVFRPYRRPEELPIYRALVEADQGAGLRDFLLHQHGSEDIGLAKPATANWFLAFSQDIVLDGLDKKAMVDGEVANPGPFRGEVDSFDLGDPEDVPAVFSGAADYRDYIKELAGIRVYRDGFGVPVEQDWLGLAKSWSSGVSWYGLKPSSTLGYIAISARHNSVLEETTDREGFRETPHYRNFFLLLQSFVRFANQTQEFLRRGWAEYRKLHKQREADVTGNSQPDELLVRVKESLAEATKYAKPLEDLIGNLTAASSRSQETREMANKMLANNPETRSRIEPLVRSLEDVVQETSKTLAQVKTYLGRLERISNLTAVVQDQLKVIRDQLSLSYETISLGLTAEALSHEIYTIAHQLSERTRNLRAYLGSRKISDSTILAYVDSVYSSISALRKQLSHLTPSLRYVRESKDVVRMSTFMADVRGYHNRRLSKCGIELRVICDPSQDFSVRMNRGKLTQVFDNLILNSDYWLREEIRVGRISKGIIQIEVLKPRIRVSDNGRGISPAVEHSLFDPFVTTKAPGRGRGLGLFIVRQLLDSDGCTIDLLPERNEDGRLYIFEVNLLGGLIDE